MKTRNKTNILVALLFAVTVGYANTHNTIIAHTKRVKIEFLSVKKGNSVQIKDETGTILYYEKIQSKGDFSKTFDLTALDNGNYTIELNKDYEFITKTFTVLNGEVTFLTEKEAVIFKPVIRKENNKVLLSKYAFEKNKMEVRIYFEGMLILSESLKGNQSLHRVYQLAEDKKGSYDIIISADKKIYEENFTL